MQESGEKSVDDTFQDIHIKIDRPFLMVQSIALYLHSQSVAFGDYLRGLRR